jgi:TolB-like protein/class 3 adenylate cyclase/AraC-like DNA-binding protein/Tfp pilus assembly protein PilF
METQKTRRLAAIMFTDIVGYTALMQKDEQAAAEIRSKHRKEFQQYHEMHHGEILQYFGDGTLSVFQSGVEAVECAIAIQRALQQGEGVPLRIGLHMGDIVFDGTEIYGDGVNLASRIESSGVAGAILISGKLNGELKNQPHVSTVSIGEFSFKNIAHPVEVFAVTNKGIKVPSRSELKGKQKSQTKSIAVLPFINRSADPENEYFTDGMTEEIINALSKVKNLKVTSRTSSFFFKNKKIPIPQIGKELNVSAILEGSIRLSGNRMRITAQLIDVMDDFHFWSETFDRSIDDVFAVQDEISLLIAEKLREHLGHMEIEDHLVAKPDISVDVYQRYLQSRYHILKMTKPEIEKGMAILSDLIAEQPNFAPAHLGMNLGYTIMGTIGFIPAAEAFSRGKSFLDTAIALDPEHPECQLQLAWICFLQEWDFAKAYVHLNKAFEQRPIVDSYQSMASTLIAEGKFDAAHNYIDTALQIDPFSDINHHLKGFIYYTQEKYEQAIEYFKKSMVLKPDAQVSILEWGLAIILAGRPEEGLRFFQDLPDDEAGNIVRLGGVTLSHASMGYIENAQAGINQLETALETEMIGQVLNLLILCNTKLGNYDAALDLIEQGVSYRLPLMVYVNVDPMLKPLRQLPRFRAAMNQIFGETTSSLETKRKYKKSLLSDTLQQQYKSNLESLMEDEKPYLDPDLTLRILAEKMEIPPNHLSQLLNAGFNQNFAEFVNRYRLEAFKKKAADPAQQHLTILGLAFESGFNSKTVFNTFFKKVEGKTPSAYWSEMRKE